MKMSCDQQNDGKIIKFRQHSIKLKTSVNEGAYLLKRLNFFSGKFISNEHYNQLKNSDNIYLHISQEEYDCSVIGDGKLYRCVLTSQDVRTICWTGEIQAYYLFIQSLTRETKEPKNTQKQIIQSQPRVTVLITFLDRDFVCNLVLEPIAFVTDEHDSILNLGNVYNKYTRSDSSLKAIIQYFYTLKDDNILCALDLFISKKSIQDLYDYVINTHNNNKYSDEKTDNESTNLCFNFQHENLMPSLRSYQAKAVNWMIYKENEETFLNDGNIIHPFWEEIKTDGGDTLYVNTYSGDVTKQFPKKAYLLPKGGILADEMGLGKTVEVLALILNNQKKERFSANRNTSSEDKRFKDLEMINATDFSLDERNFVKPPGSTKLEVFMPEQEIIFNHSNGEFMPRYLFEQKRSTSQSNDFSLTKKSKTDTDDLFEGYVDVSTHNITINQEAVSECPRRFQNDIFSEVFSLNDNWCNSSLDEVESFDDDGGEDAEIERKCLDSSKEQTIDKVTPKRKREIALDNKQVAIVCRRDDLRNISTRSASIDLNYKSEDEGESSIKSESNIETDSSNNDPQYKHVSINQKSDYPPKTNFNKKICLQMLRDHTYYIPTAETSIYADPCCICGDNGKDKDGITKVMCGDCKNIMHKECAGYAQINIYVYKCPHCAMNEITDSHCTLIVCPDTLLKQWVDEVEKHIRTSSIRYMVYTGVKGFNQLFLQPQMLAEYDLIITSFSTLRYDFNYVLASDQKLQKRLRHKRKYAILPCPLLAINFWRLCIDEAQMVEADSTKLAAMAQRLTAVHRWCVTGTPLQKNIEDMYGLVLFLSVQPYSHKFWFYRALLDQFKVGNYVPLFELSSKIMWRTSKADVENQLCLPKQTEYLTWLQFSAIEQHFYQKQLDTSAERTAKTLNKDFSYLNESLKLCDLSKQILSQLLSPLLHLRQACNHPTVVRNSYIPLEKKCVTMDQLLTKLTASTKTESEEALRKLLCAMNGLAGVEVLKNNFVKAREIYQEVMNTWKDFNHLKTDLFQKLHTLHNLCEVACKESTSTPSDVNMKDVASEADAIRSDYLNTIGSNVVSNERLLAIDIEEVKNCKIQIDLRNPWWISVIDYANNYDCKADLLSKIADELSALKEVAAVSIQGRFKSLSGLQFIFNQQLERIDEQHKLVHENLSRISVYPSKAAVEEAAECCLRPIENSQAPRCTYCSVGQVINTYERVLFSHRGYNVLENESSSGNTGFRSDTEVDRVLKVLSSLARHYGLPGELVQKSKNHLKYHELLKKEFKSIRSLYIAYHHRIQALDELCMCTMRLRFQLPHETEVKNEHYIIKPYELRSTELSLESDKVTATIELKKKQHQLLYLENLAKVQTEHDGYNPETCPICVSQFGAEWAVFKCGHCFCCKCIVELQKQSNAYVSDSTSLLRCPMCRSVTKTQEISFVVTKLKKPQGFDAEIAVKGHYSTKIEAIVRRVCWIHKHNSSDKIIVFSTWTHVLTLLSLALRDNDICFKMCESNPKHFQTILSTFKQSSVIIVLLLPLHSGSKGLNIIEATHVVIVEPALNPADELQAVGRIHRIGQTKETFVHRFIVKGTVEERMYSLLKTKAQQESHKNSKTGFTVGDLSCLFT